MALGDYTRTIYVNGTTPAVNATNLNNSESKLKELDAATTATSGTILWSNSNSGNGTTPPAPKPNSSGSATAGHWSYVQGTLGGSVAAPSGGSWACFSWYSDSSTGAMYTGTSGISVVSGGSTILSGQSGRYAIALVWKVV